MAVVTHRLRTHEPSGDAAMRIPAPYGSSSPANPGFSAGFVSDVEHANSHEARLRAAKEEFERQSARHQAATLALYHAKSEYVRLQAEHNASAHERRHDNTRSLPHFAALGTSAFAHVSDEDARFADDFAAHLWSRLYPILRINRPPNAPPPVNVSTDIRWLVDCALRESLAAAGEDLFTLPTLLRMSGRRPGTFIELGAFDGIQGSNTYMLEKCFNWTGLLIEANPYHYRLLKHSGRKVPMVHAAVCDDGPVEGFIEFVNDMGGQTKQITGILPQMEGRPRNQKVHTNKVALTTQCSGASATVQRLCTVLSLGPVLTHCVTVVRVCRCRASRSRSTWPTTGLRTA